MLNSLPSWAKTLIQTDEIGNIWIDVAQKVKKQRSLWRIWIRWG